MGLFFFSFFFSHLRRFIGGDLLGSFSKSYDSFGLAFIALDLKQVNWKSVRLKEAQVIIKTRAFPRIGYALITAETQL